MLSIYGRLVRAFSICFAIYIWSQSLPKTLSGALSRVLDARRPSKIHRIAGDRARDAHHWSEAADQYAKYLRAYPDNVAIRIQLGNCLKEAHQLPEALDAYELALQHDPSNADGHLQLGHLLKRMGRHSDAVHAYQRSFASKAEDNPAFLELINLGATIQSPRYVRKKGASASTTYVDVTDLLDYLRTNVSLSGIQRVVSNLMLHAPAFSDSPLGNQVVPVLPDYNGSKMLSIDAGILQGLIKLATENTGNRHALDRALEAVRASAQVVKLHKADTLLIPGAFWIYPRYDLLITLRQSGVQIGTFIHDLIQVTNPEFVAPDATAAFRRSFADILAVSSYILTNSRFVADDVRAYLTSRMNFELPITPVLLATELGPLRFDAETVSTEYIDLAREDYVLCVGTIEVRKNHLYLVQIWERLIKEFSGSIPNLVFVGKWGWQIDELRKRLEGSDYLGARLYIYHTISDTELAFLYQNCLLTIYPSFAEGWGLPVGESLSYGKPCIASKVTSIPEVGGTLCKYVDPFDLDDGYRVVSEVLTNRMALNSWTSRIKAEFRPRTWRDFTVDLLKVVKHYADNASFGHTRTNCILESGEVATFGNDSLAQLDAKGRKLVTARMTRLAGWHALEAWGCWAARRRAVLKVNTRLSAGTKVTVYLHLKSPDSNDSADCMVRINQTAAFLDNLGSVPAWFTAPGAVNDEGAIEIVLLSGKGFFHRNGQELYVGILGIAIAASDDAEARTKLLGQIVHEGVPSPSASIVNL